MSNILMINSQDYDDDDIIAGNVIMDDSGHLQEIIVNIQEAERGQRGVGIPSGGAPGQFMKKRSFEDFDVEWANYKEPVYEHNELLNRNRPDQHPISAITGLEEALSNAGGVAQIYRGDHEPAYSGILIWIETPSPSVGDKFITSDDKTFITSDNKVFTVQGEAKQLVTADDKELITSDNKSFMTA